MATLAGRATRHSNKAERGSGGRRISYRRLMQVSIVHSYYNHSGMRCPDFVISPTPETATLMRSLGLLFQDDGIGFSILYDINFVDEHDVNYLILYLQGLPTSPPEQHEWTKLSFVLSLKNPFFFNFTNTGIWTIKLNPLAVNFYLSNQNAHELDGTYVLNTGDHVTDTELIPITPSQYRIVLDQYEIHEINAILVRDISGHIVQCQPVWVPRDMLPGSVNCKSVYEYVNSQPNVCIEQYYPNLQCYTPPQLRFNLVQIGEGPLYGEPSLIPIDIVFIPRDVIFVNFYLLPEGKYTIQKLPRAETYTPPPKPVVYTEPTGTPVCFVDLLLTDPTCLSGGMYPVQDLWGDATIEPVSYQIRFETRATIWIYYIVPSRQKEQFEGLEIVSINHGSGAQIQPNVFGRPHKVVLNNGQFAYRFISNITIPLQEQSDFHFRLLGSPKGSAGSSGVLMDRLPVASNQQVIPEDKDFAISKPTVSQSVNRRQVGKPKIYSNIYVYV